MVYYSFITNADNEHVHARWKGGKHSVCILSFELDVCKSMNTASEWGYSSLQADIEW